MALLLAVVVVLVMLVDILVMLVVFDAELDVDGTRVPVPSLLGGGQLI